VDPLAGERLWRVRKAHTSIDAQLRSTGEARPFELRFFYDGELVFNRFWASRDAAIAFAAEQLRELQRAGWNTHW
jgi:hypothetical protein